MDGERSPALHLHMPAVDDLARGDGAAASLGAYLDLSFRLMRPGAMILASWAMSCAISERSSWKRCGFDASGGGIPRTREGGSGAGIRRRAWAASARGDPAGGPTHLGSAATSSGFTVDLWEDWKGAPDPPRYLSRAGH